MYTKKILFSLVVLTALSGGYTADITECPSLTPRSPPSSVHDLRPDDIKVIAALGDSVMAGFGAKDIDISKHLNGQIEYRGVSFAIGGDDGAATLSNYIKYYQPELKGSSRGQHEMRNCDYGICIPRYIQHLDVLNAAQGAAPFSALGRQLTYIINSMRSMKDLNFEEDWKMITIQTGANNICPSCIPFFASGASPKKFEIHMSALLERIRTEMPRTLVNMINVFNVTERFAVDGSNNRCKGSGSIPKELECLCGADTGYGWEHMAELSEAYNEKLVGLHEKYQRERSDTFAAIYRDININPRSLPEEHYSNYDCYHPSTLGHEYMSAVLWNQLFLSQRDRPTVYNFTSDYSLYCPTASDRLITY